MRTSIFKNMLLYAVPSTAALMAGAYLVQINRFGMSAFLLALAVSGYLFCVLKVAERNWMDIRALFHGVWLGTIALASLKLLDYQEVWQTKTWMCLGGAYAAFQIGACIGIEFGHRPAMWAKNMLSGRQFGKISFALQEKRLFWVCVVTTLIGILCFAANVMIRGFIPCFSDDPAAYLTFYTKFHVFAVAATCVSGLCYYCLRTQRLSVSRKVILWLCILHSTVLFPILVVSRGTFIVSSLSLTTVVFYLHKRKLWAMVACLALIFTVYGGVSLLRGYTDAQLKEIFEPSVITLPAQKPANSEEPGNAEKPTKPEEPGNAEKPTEPEEPVEETPYAPTFSLPPKVAYLYSYLTVSHDNFNEAVENAREYTYGARMFSPFNVILRSQWLDDFLAGAESHLVRPHLNTANVISTFYYDFREWGVVIGMLLWSIVFGFMQRCVFAYKGPFSMLVLGNAMPPIVLSFFAEWFANFTQWLLWGTILLMAIGSCLKIDRIGKENITTKE